MRDFPRAQIVPLPDDKVSFQYDGEELLRYHFGKDLSKPYIFPLVGPAGRPVTRIGHPHDPVGHCHHRSIWVAHQKINGVNFWEESDSSGTVAHERVVKYEDGAEHATMAMSNLWIAPSERALLRETRSVKLTPLPQGEMYLDLHLHFQPCDDSVILEKTSFGFLAVRVAKTMSVNDGGGSVRNSEGGINEPQVHWRQARWVDYSGPITVSDCNGILFMDHPSNPRHPTYWHVRDDGWMGAAFCYDEPYQLEDDGLSLRYRLFVHDKMLELDKLEERWELFGGE